MKKGRNTIKEGRNTRKEFGGRKAYKDGIQELNTRKEGIQK
jgi:hypothetical protein